MKKIKFNRKIYSDITIQTAITAYKNHADINITYIQEYAILTFSKCKYDEDQTINEFENYMIGLENSL